MCCWCSGHFISGPADPRLFVHRHTLYVSYSFYASAQPWPSDAPCHALHYYRCAMWITRPYVPGAAPIELQIPAPNDLEKNWLMFSSVLSLLTEYVMCYFFFLLI